MLILAWAASGILIFGESARISTKGKMHVWRVKNPVPHKTKKAIYGIARPLKSLLKFYIKNISFGLGTMYVHWLAPFYRFLQLQRLNTSAQ